MFQRASRPRGRWKGLSYTTWPSSLHISPIASKLARVPPPALETLDLLEDGVHRCQSNVLVWLDRYAPKARTAKAAYSIRNVRRGWSGSGSGIGVGSEKFQVSRGCSWALAVEPSAAAAVMQILWSPTLSRSCPNPIPACRERHHRLAQSAFRVWSRIFPPMTTLATPLFF